MQSSQHLNYELMAERDQFGKLYWNEIFPVYIFFFISFKFVQVKFKASLLILQCNKGCDFRTPNILIRLLIL